MKYRITHTTKYAGSEPVSVGHNQAWLTPRELPGQQCSRHRLSISPRPSSRTERIDYFGNTVVDFSFNRGYDALTVTARTDVLIVPRELPAPDDGPPWESVRDSLKSPVPPERLADLQYRFDSPQASAWEELARFAAPSFPRGRPILAAIADLTNRIHEEFEYQPQSTTVSTPLREVFQERRGVCQDFAHLQVAAIRSVGLPARYVSGYLRTRPPAGKPRLVGADASHAWVSVFCGELGWVDADPTNDVFAADEHVTVAWGRDYGDVPPLRGVFIGGGTHTLSVSVDVEPLDEAAGSNGEKTTDSVG